MGTTSARKTSALPAARRLFSRAHRVSTVPQVRAEKSRPGDNAWAPAGDCRRDSALRRAEPESSQRPFTLTDQTAWYDHLADFLAAVRSAPPRIGRVQVSAALADGRLTTSVKPIPKHGSSAYCSGRRVSVPIARRTRSLNFDAENAGQNRLVERAK